MEPAKVPQHLELEDVIAFGLGATDLVCVSAGAGAGWWLYLAVPGPLAMKIASAAPAVLVGLATGAVSLGDRRTRGWLMLALDFARRRRLLLYGGRS